MNKEINNPYLTIINKYNKYNPDNFSSFEYQQVDVKMGDWFKKTGLIEKETYQAYLRASQELESLGAKCIINSAGRTRFDQIYTKIEKFGGVLKNSKSIKKAFADTKNETAKIGYSEHLSNLALDIKIVQDDLIIPDKIRESYPNSNIATLKFLTKRLIMEKHGFILSYPSSPRLKEVTGVAKNESWHWRYVTPQHSKMIARIRERVTKDLNIKDEDGKIITQEVFLEDYVKLLSFDIESSSENELLDKYVELFKTKILNQTNDLTL